jgi:hypothetical protein
VNEKQRNGSYSSGKIDWFRLEDLKASEATAGQIYPVIKDANGTVIDGLHRKRVDPNWKEITLPITDELEAMKLRVHLNIMRRKVPKDEKAEWIQETRRILQQRNEKGTQEDIARVLGLSLNWVKKYDPKRTKQEQKRYTPCTFFGYNVWGFKDEEWRKLIVAGDPNQPGKEGYHGHTPAFIIHQLISMFQPKRVLDTMAGLGTTGYVCKQYGISYDQFDLYQYQEVVQGDAETVQLPPVYDLIFNHIPYLKMVKYGNDEQDLSAMNEGSFYEKLARIFKHNFDLLAENGVYAVLVGDWRSGGQLKPLTARTTLIASNVGFILQDAAIKLTGEMQSKTLQEYRAAEHGYLAQTYDTVLMFKKVKP